MCEFCRNDGKEHVIFENDENRWYTLFLKNGKFYIVHRIRGFSGANGIDVENCPMCGRKLSEDDMIVSKYECINGKDYVEASTYDKVLYELKATHDKLDKKEEDYKTVSGLLSQCQMENGGLKERVAELEIEIEAKDRLYQNEKGKISYLRTRCKESAAESFDKGLYGLICITDNRESEWSNTQAEIRKLKAENENLNNILEHKAGDWKESGFSFKDIVDMQYRIAELETELEVKDNLLKIKNGLCGESLHIDLGEEQIEEFKEMMRHAKLEPFKENAVVSENSHSREWLEDRHQSDCIEINRLNTALEVIIEKYQRLRELRGL